MRFATDLDEAKDASGLLANFVERGGRGGVVRGLAEAVVGAVHEGDHVAAKAAAQALLSFVEELGINEKETG
ncbi:MAG: hypothetical protein KC731_00165 [Myxococcales bacterium]|nr:hypothetical protein [Myxococcales bacterium]